MFTSSNQFGYKKGHSTDLCIYALKEFIEYYKKRSTSVFVTMLDASKAFDRVNFWTINNRNSGCYLTNLLLEVSHCLYFEYLLFGTHTKKMCIRWGNAYSPSFGISNSVKQGGMLSPILFNAYMDDLSVLLTSSNIGGRIGNIFLNHLCYADDLCLISLSSAGIQKLLGKCWKYAIDHCLIYSEKKSFSLCLIPGTLKFCRPEQYMDYLLIPNVSEYVFWYHYMSKQLWYGY